MSDWPSQQWEQDLACELEDELDRTLEKHPGTARLPDGTGGGGRETWRGIAQHACDRAAREGRLTFCHVLDEEVAEALAETDPAKLRKELVQVMNVARRWIWKLDQEEKESKTEKSR